MPLLYIAHLGTLRIHQTLDVQYITTAFLYHFITYCILMYNETVDHVIPQVVLLHVPWLTPLFYSLMMAL